MRVRALDGRSGLRLFDEDREIGYIRGATLGFVGFPDRTDAAVAACVAHRALEQRRTDATWVGPGPDGFVIGEVEGAPFVIARSGLVARLRPESEDGHGWGFEIELRPEESAQVFARGRARTAWHALRSVGWPARMLQFRVDEAAPVGAALGLATA